MNNLATSLSSLSKQQANDSTLGLGSQSQDLGDVIPSSHGQDWDQLFSELDKDHNGPLSQIEIIRRINKAHKEGDRASLHLIHSLLGLTT